MDHIIKYPRTPHLEGSKLQAGDSDADQATIRQILEDWPGATWVFEEKLDGANAGISTDSELNIRAQSRGHFLTGGAREEQFNLMKEWIRVQEAELVEILEDRYVLYGEWCFAMHTQFYDLMPHYFHEFDILDKATGYFLSTKRRNELLDGSCILSVPVVSEGAPRNQKVLRGLVGKSVYRSENWREKLIAAAADAGIGETEALRFAGSSDPMADLSEGLYLKIEDEDKVLARFKFVRPGFTQTILDNGIHWSKRPIIRNGLADDADLYSKAKRQPHKESEGCPAP